MFINQLLKLWWIVQIIQCMYMEAERIASYQSPEKYCYGVDSYHYKMIIVSISHKLKIKNATSLVRFLNIRHICSQNKRIQNTPFNTPVLYMVVFNFARYSPSFVGVFCISLVYCLCLFSNHSWPLQMCESAILYYLSYIKYAATYMYVTFKYTTIISFTNKS